MKIVFKCNRESWGAVVKKFDEGRLEFDFSAGTFQAQEGKLYIECQPGDTVAVGQDFRDSGGYIHDGTLYVVEEGGTLKKVGKVTALEYGKK